MTTKGWYLIGMLVLLFLANLAMLLGMTNWPLRTREGFEDAAKKAAAVAPAAAKAKTAMEKFADMVAAKEEEKKDAAAPGAAAGAGPATGTLEPFEDAPAMGAPAKKVQSAPIVPVVGTGSTGVPAAEGFMDFLQGGFGTAPIGAYDGRNMAAGLPPAAQGFRANHPDEPLNGPYLMPSDDNLSGLFIFQNNQCKPECCDSTLACDGGCVCTSPEQRRMLNLRGGNRGAGDI